MHWLDLIGLLNELPPATAGAMLLGLLASTYLVAGTGESRVPPGSPALPLLFETLSIGRLLIRRQWSDRDQPA